MCISFALSLWGKTFIQLPTQSKACCKNSQQYTNAYLGGAFLSFSFPFSVLPSIM